MSEADPFDEIVDAVTDLPQALDSGRAGETPTPDLAVIEAGSRTLRTQAGPPQGDDVPARPADPEVDKALREVEAELAEPLGRDQAGALASAGSPR